MDVVIALGASLSTTELKADAKLAIFTRLARVTFDKSEGPVEAIHDALRAFFESESVPTCCFRARDDLA